MSITINLNKTLYNAQKVLARLAIDNGGNIFGGYVRDKIYHDMCADDYYKYIQKIYKKEKKEDYNTFLIKREEHYTDETFHIESIGRLNIANDIDIFFSTKEEYEKFFSIISTKYKVKKSVNVKHKYDFVPETVTHIKYTVDMCELIKNKIVIELDVLYTEVEDSTIFPPFNHLDMECNCLIYNKNGINVSYKHTGVHEIDYIDDFRKIIFEKELYNNIRNKITRFNYSIFCNYTNFYNDINQKINKYSYTLLFGRYMEMTYRGWNIKNEFTKYIKNLQEENIEKSCPVCIEEIGKNEYFMLKCCGVCFHTQCLDRYVYRFLQDNNIPKCVHRCEQVDEKNYTFIWNIE